MSPLIHDGYILVGRFFRVHVRQFERKIVIASHQDKGLTVSRLKRYDPYGVLHRKMPATIGHIERKTEWKIVARVLWWIERRLTLRRASEGCLFQASAAPGTSSAVSGEQLEN